MKRFDKDAFPSFLYLILTILFYLSIISCVSGMYLLVKTEILERPYPGFMYTDATWVDGKDPHFTLSFGYGPSDNVRSLKRAVPSFRYIYVFVLTPILFTAWILILYYLKKIVISIKSGSPFHQKNVFYIRAIGALCVIIAVTYFFQLGFLFMGLIALVLSEVFRRGMLLQEEQRLTI